MHYKLTGLKGIGILKDSFISLGLVESTLETK